MARSVHVNQRLRPLRLAFFVAPDDEATLMRIVEINTCLWGGIYNPIVPLFRETPANWDAGHREVMQPHEIVAGYLGTFEPDLYVFSDKGAADGLGLDPHLVLTLADVLDEESRIAVGVSVLDRYRHLWDETFRFVQKDPPSIVLPTVSSSFSPGLVAAACGRFPGGAADYFERNYRDVFEPRESPLSATELFDVQSSLDAATPLRIGASGLGRLGRRHQAVLVLDQQQPLDLIDYWNLRAVGWRVVTVPIMASADLTERSSKFIIENHVAYPENLELKQRTSVVHTRSVQQETVMAWTSGFEAATREGFHHSWYPRLWEPGVERRYDFARPELRAGEARTECTVAEGAITFHPLKPKFEVDHNVGKPRWAEVVEVRAYSSRGDVAAVWPRNLTRVRDLLDAMDSSWDMSTSSEGVVIRRTSEIGTYHWKLPDGQRLTQHWLKTRGRATTRSSAGRTAAELLRMLEGPFGAHVIANADLLTFFNSLARPALVKSARYPDVVGQLRRAYGNDKDRAKRALDRLVDAQALRVGLDVKCPLCDSWNWYSLPDLADTLRCARCLREFPFPATKPSRSDWSAWAYRPQGPFAIDKYADGAYAVALALRFLTVTMEGEASWATGLQVEGLPGTERERELDVVAWWRRSWFGSDAPVLVLGECKSFSAKFGPRFGEIVARVAEPRDRVVLLFATLDSELQADEKAEIRSLLETVRKALPGARALVLTARELFTRERFPHCWEDQGEPFTRWAKARGFESDLDLVCKATEAVYLSEAK